MARTKAEPHEKNPGGRPSKFTPERCAAIIDAIYHRIPYQLAAEANGISEKTLYLWLETAKQELEEGLDTEYTKFLQGIKSAEYQRIREHSNKISENVDRWQADAWMLERRWYKHYSTNAALAELNERLMKLEQMDLKNDSDKAE